MVDRSEWEPRGIDGRVRSFSSKVNYPEKATQTDKCPLYVLGSLSEGATVAWAE